MGQDGLNCIAPHITINTTAILMIEIDMIRLCFTKHLRRILPGKVEEPLLLQLV